ncbi:hypothetical protein FOMG_16228 [Fusarium oxysporum f. sp. melonis 26406]|uniref:Uncharacterized protein n=1 Tax=Fusarium oxysporum f. sp. melonis 26406 TaxID=1089452 RepID=W9ZFS4_FUSOX|nr:hypothetical protein FOMG_16228 [Fusarium oxysporum f. sp. melonis 26406]
MAVILSTRVRKRNRSNENFRKKWSTLMNNDLIIHHVYDAEVYNETFPLPVLVTAVDVAHHKEQPKFSEKDGSYGGT